jgi:hypothetical protein
MQTRAQERAAAEVNMPKLFAHSAGVTAFVRAELLRAKTLSFDIHAHGGARFRVRVHSTTTQVDILKLTWTLTFPHPTEGPCMHDDDERPHVPDAHETATEDASDAESETEEPDGPEAVAKNGATIPGVKVVDAATTAPLVTVEETFLFSINASEVWLGQFSFEDLFALEPLSAAACKSVHSKALFEFKKTTSVQSRELAPIDAEIDARLAKALAETGKVDAELRDSLGCAVALVGAPQERFKLPASPERSTWNGCEYDRMLTIVGPSILQLPLYAKMTNQGFQQERVVEFVAVSGENSSASAYLRTSQRYILPACLNYCNPTLEMHFEALSMHTMDLLGMVVKTADGCTTLVPEPDDWCRHLYL